jgi:hypothetical protein
VPARRKLDGIGELSGSAQPCSAQQMTFCARIREPGRGVALYSIRFFRTFGAGKKQKSPAISNLHDLSNHTFTLFPKSIQVADWRRLVRSFLFEAAPKVRNNRIECNKPTAYSTLSDLSTARQLRFMWAPYLLQPCGGLIFSSIGGHTA